MTIHMLASHAAVTGPLMFYYTYINDIDMNISSTIRLLVDNCIILE